MSGSDENSNESSKGVSSFRILGTVHGRAVHSRRVEVLAAHFAALLSQNHSVLDVGCGDGMLDKLILQRRPDASICGVDVLVRQQTHIQVTPFDGVRLPFPDKAFDTVMFSDVLHHTESPTAMLKEAVRVGRHCLLIKDHLVQGWLARPTLRIMDFVGNAPHGVVLPYNYLTLAQWDDVFRKCHVTPRTVIHRLGLYPAWADFIFGRSLHFVGLYDICS